MTDQPEVPTSFDPYAMFEVDKVKEMEGAEVPMNAACTLILGRWFNKNHQAALERYREPYRSITGSGRKIPDDLALDIGIKAMAECVFLGWKGTMLGRDRQPLQNNLPNRIQLLRDLSDMRDFITNQSSNATNYRIQEVVAAAGESSTGSDGTDATQQTT